MSQTPVTSGRGPQRLFSVPISVLGLSFALLLVSSEVTSTSGGRSLARWSTCEVSLRLGVAGWERTTRAILFAKRLDQAAAAASSSEFDSVPVPTRVVADESLYLSPVSNSATSSNAMARRGQGDLPPPIA
jgi:hypothetical protein